MSNVNVGNITGTATLNATQFVQGAGQAVGALQQLEYATAANWWGLQNLGRAFAIVPAAIAAGIGASINTYMDWQDAIADVERTTYEAARAGETLDQANERNAQTLGRITDEIREMASEVPVAASELASIAAEAGSLGVAAKDVGQFTEVFARLRATTDVFDPSAFARVAGLVGVTSQTYDNLASSILEVGRTTAATETEILDLANRIAGTGASAGLAGDEIIGFAAAIRSAGIRAESGGTAFNKTFQDIQRAVSAGGDELQLFAAVAGVTASEFKSAWTTDAAGVFTDFIVGFGKMQAAGQDTTAVLDELGITEARQTQFLRLLGQAQTQTANENLKLTNALDVSRQAFVEGTALTEISEKRFKTLSNQIRLLRNEIYFAAAAFGATFAPVLGFVVERLRDFIAGITVLPAPLKIVMGVMIAFTAALLAIASAAILIGPRIVIALAALRQLQGSSAGTTAALGGLSGSMLNAGRSAQVLTASANQATGAVTRMNLAAINSNMSNWGKPFVAGAGAASAYTGAATQAAGATSSLALWAGRLGKTLGVVGIALSVATVLLTIFGSQVRSANSALTDQVSVNQQLREVLTANGNVVDKSTEQWIKQSEVWPKIQAGIGKYGSSLADVQALIQGTASNDEYKKFLDDTTKAYEDGDKGARTFSEAVITLSREFGITRQEVAALIGPIQDVTTANGDLADSFNSEEEIAELEKLRRALEDQANAHVDYVQALRDQQRAQFDLIDAQKAYDDALADAEDPSRVLAGLERDLAKSRRDQLAAQKSVAKAEEDLAKARQNQQEDLEKSLEDLEDAQDSYSDSQLRLAETEKELAKLRQGPELKDIIKATNDLRDAQLRLQRAEQGVADAEWYLNYLRQEGASARDIQDAELGLEEARAEQANSSEDLAESEQELADARRGASPEELAEAEEAYSDALRATQRAHDDLLETEEEVANLRNEIANDTAYQDAQDNLLDAQDRLADTTERLLENERELNETRDEGLARDLAEAENELFDAVYNVAKANADAIIAQREMNGEVLDASDKAHILAEQLGLMSGAIPNQADRDRLQQFIDVLSSSPDIPDPIDRSDVFSDDLFDFSDIEPIMPSVEDFASGFEQYANDIPGATKLSWKQLWNKYGKELALIAGGFILGGLVAAIFGIPFGLAVAISSVALFIADQFGDDIIKFFTDVAGPALAHLFTDLIPGWFRSGLDFVGRNVGKLFLTLGLGLPLGLLTGLISVIDGDVRDFFFGLPGMFLDWLADPDTWLVDVGKFIIGGLLTGLLEIIPAVWSFFTAIPGTIIDFFASLYDNMSGIGGDAITGILDGAGSIIGDLLNFFSEIPGKIFGYFDDVASFFFGLGSSIIDAIIAGIGFVSKGLFSLLSGLPAKFKGYFSTIWDTFKGIGKDIINGIVSGIGELAHLVKEKLLEMAKSAWNSVKSFFGIGSPSKEFAWIGEMLMIGLANGIDSTASKVIASAADVAGQSMSQFDDARTALNDMMATDALRSAAAVGIGAGGSGAFGGAPAVPTIINEGDTFNLEAKTDADPEEIVGEFMWQNNLRKR